MADDHRKGVRVKIKRRYIITALVIMIALLLLFYPALQHRKIPAFLHFQSPIMKAPKTPTGVLPVDLSHFNVNQSHTIELLQQNDIQYIGVSVDESPHLLSQKEYIGWLLQCGSFADKNNALQLQDKLMSLGYGAFIVLRHKADQPYWVVFVGPVLKRTQAETIYEQLSQQLTVTSMIVPYKLNL